ncbi:hypothetical protein V1511DRAFT_498743 [Dipodascopsis uninucleata]
MAITIFDLPTEILVEVFLLVIKSSEVYKKYDIEECSANSTRNRTVTVLRHGILSSAFADLTLDSSSTVIHKKNCATVTQFNSACTISLVCKRFYAIIFHPVQDFKIWGFIAASFGYDRTLSLDSLLKGGNSYIPSRKSNRSWRTVCKLAACWDMPFEPISESDQKPMKLSIVTEKLPNKKPKNVIRSFDLAIPGQGRLGPSYTTSETTIDDCGNIFLQVTNGDESIRTVAKSCYVLSPNEQSKKVVSQTLDHDTVSLELSQPNQCNLILREYDMIDESRNLTVGYQVDRYCVRTGDVDGRWKLGSAMPERYIAYGDKLLTLHSPNMVFFWTGSTDNPARLRCYIQKEGNTSDFTESGFDSSIGLKDMPRSKLLWDINLSLDWKGGGYYEQFCVVQNMHMTARHAIILVHWYPTSSMHRLSATSFRILDLQNGHTIKILKFGHIIMTPFPPYTTISQHDFAITDTHIVSGGPNGRLYVWNYHNRTVPLYTLPEPNNTKNGGPAGPFAPTYTSLSISSDGKFVAASASNRLVVWNMYTKKIEGIFHNGRKVGKKEYFLKNPFDNFKTGVWILYRDWRNKKTKRDSLSMLLDDDCELKDDSVETYELVAEKFKYVTEPLSQWAGRTHLDRDSYLSVDQSWFSIELGNAIEACLFWIYYIVVTIWLYICFTGYKLSNFFGMSKDSGLKRNHLRLNSESNDQQIDRLLS